MFKILGETDRMMMFPFAANTSSTDTHAQNETRASGVGTGELFEGGGVKHIKIISDRASA